MSMLMMSIFLLALAALAITATVFGVDSREGSDDSRRSPYPTGIR
jgi:hypothetical protein